MIRLKSREFQKVNNLQSWGHNLQISRTLQGLRPMLWDRDIWDCLFKLESRSSHVMINFLLWSEVGSITVPLENSSRSLCRFEVHHSCKNSSWSNTCIHLNYGMVDYEWSLKLLAPAQTSEAAAPISLPLTPSLITWEDSFLFIERGGRYGKHKHRSPFGSFFKIVAFANWKRDGIKQGRSKEIILVVTNMYTTKIIRD